MPNIAVSKNDRVSCPVNPIWVRNIIFVGIQPGPIDSTFDQLFSNSNRRRSTDEITKTSDSTTSNFNWAMGGYF